MCCSRCRYVPHRPRNRGGRLQTSGSGRGGWGQQVCAAAHSVSAPHIPSCITPRHSLGPLMHRARAHHSLGPLMHRARAHHSLGPLMHRARSPQPWSPHASSTGKGYAADGHPPRCYSLYTRATPSSPIACAKPAMLCPAGQPPYRGVGGTVPCRLSWAGWCSRRPGIAHRSGCLHRCSVPAGSKVRNLTLCILPMLCMG